MNLNIVASLANNDSSIISRLLRLSPSSRAFLSFVVVSIACVPLIFVIDSSLQLSFDKWLNLWSTRLFGLMWNTLSLAILVAIGALILGVTTAWILVRREFVGRRLAMWFLILPLTIPTYVFSYIYTNLLDDDGWLNLLWKFVFGELSLPPDLYNIFGVAFVLTLAGFSYVFLLVHDALTRTKQNLEEAAQIQGASKRQIFFSINLPLLRPAIAASMAMVVLHVLSDFGAVSTLRFQTFTLSIFNQMNGRFDYNAAAGLSLVLVSLSLSFLILERFFRSRQRYFSGSQSRTIKRRPVTKLELIFIWCWLGTISLFSFFLPLAWMISWSVESWLQGLINVEFWSYVGNSLSVSFITAFVTVFLALPIALYHARKRNLLSQSYVQLSSVGFVLPGPVIALGILVFILAWLEPFYGGLMALVLAMVIRFLPLAVQSQESAVQQITPNLELAGRSLGATAWENLWRVILPSIRGGMFTAWVLVFIDTLKELPATIILRPIGFDTLPVRIWIEASEEMLELAAPAALLLVICTLPVLWFLLKPMQSPEN
ncbi:Ferric iron ABC transporter, permease protein [hydrothermal vent metagenome]|uniref:Ferric iron ABC transporter, permease protein n=1 Tax=hydrothermal vent metagenome TaxID=652676 RepID=A0A3B1AHP7_9ZZZZ